jgi:hypothetical protein
MRIPGVCTGDQGDFRRPSSHHLEDPVTTSEALYSSMVRSGRTTYFVDVKEAKNGKKYLTITENRIDDEDKKTRVTVRVFKESIDQFRQAVDEAAAAVNN